MKSSLFSALLGLTASVAGTPISTSDDPAPSSLATTLDDGGYYPDPTSDTPWNGTIISPDERDLDWTPDEAHDTWIDPSSSALTKRHPNYFTFYRRDWFYTSCSNPTNCQNYQLDHIQVHNDCNGGNCNGDFWRDTDWDENLCDKSFRSCGKTYTMGYTGKD